METDALVFRTDPTRYRKLRIICIAVGSGFLLMALLAIFRDFASLGGAAVAVVIAAGLLFLGI